MFDSEEQEPQSQKLYVFERKTVKPEDIKRLVAKGENARRSAASPRRCRQATTPPTPAPTDDEVLE